MYHPYRFHFEKNLPIVEVRTTLLTALSATEGLFARALVRLEASFILDEQSRICLIDAATPVGQTLCQIFTELLIKNFNDSFTVELFIQTPSPEFEVFQ